MVEGDFHGHSYTSASMFKPQLTRWRAQAHEYAAAAKAALPRASQTEVVQWLEDRYRPNEQRKRTGKPPATGAVKAPRKAKGITDYFASESDDHEAGEVREGPDNSDGALDYKHEDEVQTCNGKDEVSNSPKRSSDLSKRPDSGLDEQLGFGTLGCVNSSPLRPPCTRDAAPKQNIVMLGKFD